MRPPTIAEINLILASKIQEGKILLEYKKQEELERKKEEEEKAIKELKCAAQVHLNQALSQIPQAMVDGKSMIEIVSCNTSFDPEISTKPYGIQISWLQTLLLGSNCSLFEQDYPFFNSNGGSRKVLYLVFQK